MTTRSEPGGLKGFSAESTAGWGGSGAIGVSCEGGGCFEDKIEMGS